MKSLPGFRIALLFAALALPTPAVHGQGFAGVFTQHNDVARTGENLDETLLTIEKVNPSKFGKVFSYPVDGQIYAQPLYVPNVSIPNQGVHNVIYVATENDSLYAFDADDLTPNILWHLSFIDPPKGITTVNCIATGMSCNVYPIVGITSTPVIDPSSSTIYLVVRTQENNSSVQRLHALDITTGVEKFGGPVEITAVVAGTGSGTSNGKITFDPLHDIQRTALLLLNGTIYIGWAGEAHGWAMAYNAHTLAQVAVVCTTPNGSLGGVWQAGGGMAADSQGSIYFATGDGTFDASTGGIDYGDTLLKMDANLKVLDYFTPMDQACRIPNDLDLASGGPLILPPQSGPFADEIIQSGKGGSPCDLFGSTYAVPIYLVNRDNMGKYNPAGDQDIETVEGTIHGYWSSPTYWQGPSAQYVYYSGQTNETGTGDYLKQYSLTDGVVSAAPLAQTENLFQVGSTPSLSANGTSNGIVWAVERKDVLASRPGTQPAVLHAYNATDVSIQLYNSAHAKQLRDQPGCGNKFVTPTVANGQVYVGTQNELDVYGVLPAPQTTPVPTISAPCFAITGQTVGQASPPVKTILSNLGPGNLTIASIAVTGSNASEFAQTNSCGSSLAAGTSCTLSITFTATLVNIPQVATIIISDNAAGGGQSVALVGVATKK
jgi:hypothetical protein